MTGRKSSNLKQPLLALALLATATLIGLPGCSSSGGIADLVPGHEEAALRKRVEADSFPSADQSLHGPIADSAGQSR